MDLPIAILSVLTILIQDLTLSIPMPDLSGAQFEKFRMGLTELFWEETRLQAFLRENWKNCSLTMLRWAIRCLEAATFVASILPDIEFPTADMVTIINPGKQNFPKIVHLTGVQIDALREGLQGVFPEIARCELFLREKLERNLVDYAGPDDPRPIAFFRLITGALAEGWAGALIWESHQAYAHNPNLAGLARQLQQGIRPAEAEEEAARTGNLLWLEFNPYRGLEALQKHDADFLFGRNDDVDRFIDAIATHPSKILLALGASGVGKSSLIYAGVLGALNRRALKSNKPWPIALENSHQWPHLVVFPGAEPLRALAAAFLREWIDPTTALFADEADRWRGGLGANKRGINRLIDAADEAWRDDRVEKRRSAATGPSDADQTQARKRPMPPPRYLLYVDQGEELYTRGGREPGFDNTRKETPQQQEARRFSELLAEAAAHPRLLVLMSARSDFLDRLQADRPILDAHYQMNIPPLSQEGLAEVVRQPATMLGVSFESGLDAQLVGATREQPGSLPLLSYTLEALWAEMQERNNDAKPPDPTLRRSGPAAQEFNIAEKLAERADAFLKIHQTQEPVLRRLFCVRLAHVPQQGGPTRQTALLDDLTQEERSLVTELAGKDNRILVTGMLDGRAIASVAHETLFGAWSTLRRWISDRRSFYAWATQIAAMRKDYETIGRSALVTGRPLELAKRYLEGYEEDISEKDRTFVRASMEADRRRRTLIQSGLATAFVSIAIALGLAIWSGREAAKVRDEALLNQSKTLTEFSLQASRGGNEALGLLLALEALPDKKSSSHATAERPYWGPAENALESARLATRERGVLAGHLGYVSSVAVTPDGARIVTASEDNIVRIWDAATGRELTRFQGHEGVVSSVGVTPDGRRILSGSYDTTGRIWDTASGRELAQLKGHKTAVTSIAVTSDGSRIVTGSDDKTARIWDAADGGELAQLQGHQASVTSVAVTPDGTRIITGSNDKTARIWDAASGRELAQLMGHKAAVTSIAVTPDGSRIVTGSDDKTARIWDAADGGELAQLQGHQASVTSVAVTPDGTRIITGSDDKTARIWDAASGRELALLKDHEGPVICVAVTPDGAHIVTGSWDNTARIWDAATGREFAKLKSHDEWSTIVAETPDGGKIVTGYGDGMAQVWDVATGHPLADLEGHEGGILSVAVTSDGSRVVTGSWDKTARLWDAVRGRELHQLKGHKDGVLSVAVTPDGSRIITGSWDNTARIWDGLTGSEIAQLEGHADGVSSVAVTPDGSRVLTTSFDNTVRIWDATTGHAILTFADSERDVYDVVVTPNGAHVVTGSSENMARSINLATGRKLPKLEGAAGYIYRVVVTPNGSFFSAGDIETVTKYDVGRFWSLFSHGQTLIDEIKVSVARCLTKEERRRYYLDPTPPQWCYDLRKWPYDNGQPLTAQAQ